MSGFKQSDTVATLQTMLQELKDIGFTGIIEVPYSGSGDSGDIEEPKLDPKLAGAIAGLGYKFEYGGGYTYENDGMKRSNSNSRECLMSCISEVLPGGWEINEGSNGTVELNIDTGTITVKHNEYETVSNYQEWEID